MTKYPSIPTYHTLGEKGTLLEETVSFEGEVILTEKVDGTNARIILLPDGSFILGSREELLYASLDEGAMGRAEGIVARTSSRSAIAKLRFEDYERHAKRHGK
jgi:hypothetical protein